MASTPRRRSPGSGPSRSGAGSRPVRTSARVPVRARDVPPAVRSSIDAAGEPSTTTDATTDPTTSGDAAGIAAGVAAPPRSRRTRRASSRPSATRPAARSGAGRRIRRITAAVTGPPATPRTKSRVVLQVAVLGLVFCAVAFVLAVPLRTYLTQRDQLTSTLSQEERMQDQLQALQEQKAALLDPAYIASEAHRRLQYVRPGDTVYVVHAPALPTPRETAETRAADPAPWYADLWNTLSDPVASAPATPGSAAPTPRGTG